MRSAVRWRPREGFPKGSSLAKPGEGLFDSCDYENGYRSLEMEEVTQRLLYKEPRTWDILNLGSTTQNIKQTLK